MAKHLYNAQNAGSPRVTGLTCEIVSQPYAPTRKPLLVTASVSAIASATLFIYRPIPPVGLVAAIDLAFLSALFFWQAFFPRQVQWMTQKMARMGKAKDDPGAWPRFYVSTLKKLRGLWPNTRPCAHPSPKQKPVRGPTIILDVVAPKRSSYRTQRTT